MQISSGNRSLQARIALPGTDSYLWHWITLNILDAVLTAYLLSTGGIEGNPLLAFVQGQFGVTAMLLIKVAVATLVGFVISGRGYAGILKLSSLMMAVVVMYNAVLTIGVAPLPTLPFIS